MNEYLKTCFFADKLFNEYFDNYIFRKNVLEIINLDINTQNNNEDGSQHPLEPIVNDGSRVTPTAISVSYLCNNESQNKYLYYYV